MRPELPPPKGKDADPGKLKTFMDWVFRQNTPYRLELRRRLNRARLYRQSLQWLEPAMNADPTATADWQVMTQPSMNGIPMPVLNKIFPRVTRESALLVKVGSKPSVRPDSDDPKIEQAAEVGRSALVSKLEDLSSGDKDREGSTRCTTYGTWWEARWWDIDFTKTEMMPVTSAVGCGCGFQLADPNIPDEETAMGLNAQRPGSITMSPGPVSPNPLIMPDDVFTATSCSDCGGELSPIIPDKNAVDKIGRPMGEDIPIGDINYEILSAYDAYPDPSSQGVQSSPTSWEEFGWQMPRSLDWLKNRYENGDLVKAESSSDLFQYHPIVGGLGGVAIGLGSPGLFENHAMWSCFAKKPYIEKINGIRKKNLGRLVIMAGRHVMYDGDLMIESRRKKGLFIPGFDFDWAQWELRDLEAHGIGMVELVWSQQDAINTSKSQVMDTRHRHGSPKWLLEQGIDMSYVGGADSQYNSDYLYFYRTDPATQEPPIPFGDKLFSGEVWKEIEYDESSIDDTIMAREVESGNPPGGVEAYSALLLLAQKAAEGRTPRVERIRDMKTRRYRYFLELMAHFYVEERFYKITEKNNKKKVKSFLGKDLMGQTDIMLEDEPIIDLGIVKRETLAMGIRYGSITLNTAADKMRFNRALEIPLDVQEGPNIQVETAEGEFQSWLDDNTEPVIDHDGDDNVIHWQVHKEDLSRQQWVDLKELCQWNKVLLLTWGWKEQLTQLTAQEAAFKAQPPIPPVEQKVQIDPAAYQSEIQSYQMSKMVMDQIAQMPKAIELRILMIWTRMLAQAQFTPAPADPNGVGAGMDATKAFTKVMRAEAHAAGHNWISRMENTAADQGMAIPSAPGGVTNQAGMIPSTGEAAKTPGGAGAETIAPQGGGK